MRFEPPFDTFTMRTLFFILSFFAASNIAISQVQQGSWRALLNYSEALDVDALGDEIYVATKNAIFVYNKTDNGIERITRINGLSDIGIVMLKAVPGLNTMIVGYENGNIDLIRNRVITNVPDLRNSSIQGNKTIRHATIGPEFVYLSTGIGVLAFDVERREIRNTYRIVAAENLSINQTALNGNELYAATSEGLYVGSIDTDLTIFNNWEIDLGIPDPFGNVAHCEAPGAVIAINQSGIPQPGLYIRNEAGTWELLQESSDIGSLTVTPAGLILTTTFAIQARDVNTLDITQNFLNYNGETARPSSAYGEANGLLWIADINRGLVRREKNGAVQFIAPDGPGTNNCFQLTFERNELWVASGGTDRPGLWGNLDRNNGFYQYKNDRWTNYTTQSLPFLEEEPFRDITDIHRFAENEERILVSSWYSGVMEMRNGEVINHFTTENSSLKTWAGRSRPDGKDFIGSIGFQEDEDGNVWMLTTRNDNPLSVYQADGTWRSMMPFIPSEAGTSAAISPTSSATHMIINQQGHHWILVNREGVVVFDPGDDLSDPTQRRARKFTASSGGGGLPSNEVYCIAEDLDGIIWVGTNDGIGVFFSPFDAFSENPSDARPILVEQGGIFQPLFENQPISVITVDGANRKWVGTYGSGVFLMSADGTEQLRNFTTTNSPLLSNRINDIAIDPETGEVYIATEEGLMVYGGDASQGSFQNECTTVFPNPVRETYDGPISITGLVRDSEVRITDVRGNLVASVVSNGGTAVWDGRNQNRERVATGVYFALSSDREGTTSCVSKILVIK